MRALIVVLVAVPLLVGCAGIEGSIGGDGAPDTNHIRLEGRGAFGQNPNSYHSSGYRSLRASALHLVSTSTGGTVVSMIQQDQDCGRGGDPTEFNYIPGSRREDVHLDYTVRLPNAMAFCVTWYNPREKGTVEADTAVSIAREG